MQKYGMNINTRLFSSISTGHDESEQEEDDDEEEEELYEFEDDEDEEDDDGLPDMHSDADEPVMNADVSSEGDAVPGVQKNSYSSTANSNPVFNEFNKLGLLPELVQGLAEQRIEMPTGVQKAVISRLMKRENMVMAASTGSGKTLAYLLPVIQTMMTQEAKGYKRQERRPRCLILVPTRDLAKQVLSEIKSKWYSS
jgi:ATP-dependent helicase YprA (DUF1998 family)